MIDPNDLIIIRSSFVNLYNWTCPGNLPIKPCGLLGRGRLKGHSDDDALSHDERIDGCGPDPVFVRWR